MDQILIQYRYLVFQVLTMKIIWFYYIATVKYPRMRDFLLLFQKHCLQSYHIRILFSAFVKPFRFKTGT